VEIVSIAIFSRSAHRTVEFARLLSPAYLPHAIATHKII